MNCCLMSVPLNYVMAEVICITPGFPWQQVEFTLLGGVTVTKMIHEDVAPGLSRMAVDCGWF